MFGASFVPDNIYGLIGIHKKWSGDYEIEVPKIKILTVPENAVININEPIYGKLNINLISDQGEINENQQVIRNCNGEHVVVMLPKDWCNKKVVVRYKGKIKSKIENGIYEICYDAIIHLLLDIGIFDDSDFNNIEDYIFEKGFIRYDDESTIIYYSFRRKV